MLRRAAALARDERGVSLILALLITSALTISTAALALLMASNEHAFGRDRQETLAFNTAEAGLNYAISYLGKVAPSAGSNPGDSDGTAALHSQVPTQSGSYTAFSSAKPATTMSFGPNPGTGDGQWWAEKTGTHTWTVWATGLSSNSNVERELSVQVLSTTQPGTFTPASLAWSYGLFIANPGASCFTPQGTADIDISVYVNGCIKISGSAGIQEPSTSTGNTIKVFALTTISVTGSASIGTSAKKIAAVTALGSGGCTDGNGKNAVICTNSDTTHVHAYQHNGTGSALTKPTVNADTVYAKADWKNGPVCTTSGGGTSFPVFDNDTTRNTGAPNPNLMPSNNYSCTVYATSAHTGTPVGTLSWDNGTKKLSASGTLFFDTNLSLNNGAAAYTAGTFATFYVDGTVTMNGNAALCGPPATPSGSSCSGKWIGTQGAIVIAALNHNNASPAWKANGTVEYDVAAYVIGQYQNNGGANVTGPVVTDTALVSGTGSSTDVSDPPDTAPGGETTSPGATSWALVPATWQQLKPA